MVELSLVLVLLGVVLAGKAKARAGWSCVGATDAGVSRTMESRRSAVCCARLWWCMQPASIEEIFDAGYPRGCSSSILESPSKIDL